MQLASVQAERNSLREDLVNYRTSKRHVDSSWRAERDKAERLEKELSFYQGQSARAMADRDKVLNARSGQPAFHMRHQRCQQYQHSLVAAVIASEGAGVEHEALVASHGQAAGLAACCMLGTFGVAAKQVRFSR